MAPALIPLGQALAPLVGKGFAAKGVLSSAAKVGLGAKIAGGAKTAATILTAGAAGKSALDKPDVSDPQAPLEPDEQAILRAKSRESQRRQGRASTILTDGLG